MMIEQVLICSVVMPVQAAGIKRGHSAEGKTNEQ